MSKNKKIFVGLSGGVDSSVAAAILQAQGYDVTGVYMKNWSADIAGVPCPWREDLASARSVAAHLKIPFKIYDFEDDYKHAVVDYMVAAYKSGLTPNPDVMCNQEIKFKVFSNRCIDDGADTVATGHYARLESGQLEMAKDKAKDQTYFLYRMDQAVAQKTLFPIGRYTKLQVRELAREYKLPTAGRKDSQGLCFVGKVPLRDFLSQYIKPEVGDIIDENGNVIGRHDGAFYYTIGQRHGLGVGGGQPYFVYDKDIKQNIVYVTTDLDSKRLNHDNFEIVDCVWWHQPRDEVEYKVRIRHGGALLPAKLAHLSGSKYEIKLEKSERAIAAGQSAVLYDGETVLGGGVIV